MKGKSNGKKNLAQIRALAQTLAAERGISLYDVAMEHEGGQKYLRVYIDKQGGITLNDCEAYHRALIPLVEDYEYDYLEVSSPGIDRELKFDFDIRNNMGSLVEVRLYEPLNGAKVHKGLLAEMAEEVRIRNGNEETVFPRAKVAKVKLVPDLSALEGDDTDNCEVIEEE